MLTKFPLGTSFEIGKNLELEKKVIHCNISQNIAICLKIAIISYRDIGIVMISYRDSHP